MDTDTSVPFGTGMASISLPSVPLIGIPRGNTISRPVLRSSEKRVLENIQGWLLTLYGVMLLEGSWRPKTFNLNVRTRKLITYSRSVSRQTASRYGRETSLSWLRSSPLFSCFASRISCRSFACTSLWRARRWKMRDRAPDVVSVAAKVKELQAGDYFQVVLKFIYLFDSRNLTQEFFIWKSIFVWSFHVLPHWISMSYEWNVVRGKMKPHIECWWCLSPGLSGQRELGHPFEEPPSWSPISPQMFRERY